MVFGESMRIVCISDTHFYALDQLKIPDGDALFHAGDGCGMLEAGLYKLAESFKRQPHKYKIYVPGNHDGFVYYYTNESKNILARSDVTLLIDASLQMGNTTVYGSPWTPEFKNWYFMLPRNGDGLASVWSQIPTNTEFLITHGPPFGILDRTEEGNNAGCELLYQEIVNRVQPKYHMFGHIHEHAGVRTPNDSKTTYINASVIDRRMKLRNEPIVIDL